MYRVLIAFIFLLISVTANAGMSYWGMKAELWGKFNEIERILYVQGIFDGLILHEKKVHGTELSSDLTVSQYVKAVDELYSDYKNTLIPVPFLLKIITLEIEGKGQEIINSTLVKYRKYFANLNKQ